MHDAPSVTCPVGRSRWAGALLLALWLAGALAALAWSLQPAAAGWRLMLAWLAWAVSGTLALRNWWHTPAGRLAWDGAAWTWHGGGAPERTGRLQPGLDLQHTLLVCWHDGAQRRWIWLERRQARERWDDVRRAVYSRARPEAPPAEPPAAKP